MFIWGCLQQCYIRIGTGLHDGIIINRSLWVTRGQFSRSESLLVDFGRQTFYWAREPIESILQRSVERSELEPSAVRSTQDRPCHRVGWALMKWEILIPVRQTCTKLMEASA